MNWYQLHDTSKVYTPALLFYKERIEQNLAEAIRLVGSPSRLRPHAKTHKTRELAQLELAAGVTKHKCATLAEAEMLASVGIPDVMIAYPLVGPNCARLGQLMRKYPGCRFSVTVDSLVGAELLSRAMHQAGLTADVWLDLDVGMHRTGIAPSPAAEELYLKLGQLLGIKPVGFQIYDGHNHQETVAEREQAVQQLLAPVLDLRARLVQRGQPVPSLVAGGTPTFPVFARLNIPGLECSPGTLFLHDHGYGSRFVDLAGFQPAALLLSRLISKPAPGRITLDLGYKAIASDPPAGKRCQFLNLPNASPILQNEEHFAIEVPNADALPLGTEVYAVPTHICPTCAMHRAAYVVEKGHVVGTWEIVGRDRQLSV